MAHKWFRTRARHEMNAAYMEHFDAGYRETTGETIRGRRCYATLSLTAIACHSLGICTVVFLSLLSFLSK